jgi:outer membrane protein assembly factor BamB
MIRPRSLSALCTLALACACCALARADDNWPQLRGSQSLGVSDHQNQPDKWTTTDNVAWKTDLPGRGWSSPVVWGSRIFVTTVVNQGESEEPKKGLYFGGYRLEPSKSPHVWKVICLDLESGQVRWEKTAHEGIPSTPIHLKNSYASETPVTDGERVYAYFGNVGVFCYDLEGKELWQYKVEPHAMRYGWGTAASPVLHEGRLYIVNDNDDASYLLALDAKTGQEVWKVARDEKSNWATPFVWNNGARTEIVTPGTGKVRSYDLAGNLLWELGGMSSITIATPYSQYGLLYLSSGYVMDKQRPLLAVKPGAVGDISLTDEQTSNDYVAWCQKEGGPYNPTTIVYDGIVYVLYDR